MEIYHTPILISLNLL